MFFLNKEEIMPYMLSSCCIKVFPKCCKEAKNSHRESFKKTFTEIIFESYVPVKNEKITSNED